MFPIAPPEPPPEPPMVAKTDPAKSRDPRKAESIFLYFIIEKLRVDHYRLCRQYNVDRQVDQ